MGSRLGWLCGDPNTQILRLRLRMTAFRLVRDFRGWSFASGLADDVGDLAEDDCLIGLVRQIDARLAGECAGQFLLGHLEGIDERRLEVRGVRQRKLVARGAMVVEVPEVELIRCAGREIVGAFEFVEADVGVARDEIVQELDARSGVAAETAGVGPAGFMRMRTGVRRDEDLAVRGVAAIDGGEPEAARHLFGGEIAPAALDVALVLNLVVDDRLVPCEAALGGLLEVVALQAGVRAPGLGVVVDDARVMDGTQVAVRVLGLHDAEEVIPVGHCLRADEVVFVRDGPPDVAECRETRDCVAEIEVVDFVGHGLVAPGVVGVEEDAVGLDAGGLELEEALLETLKVLGVEAGVVVGFAGGVGRAVGGEWQHLFALDRAAWAERRRGSC